MTTTELIFGDVRVRFVRHGDRLVHEIGFANDDAPMLVSVEGTADESWPASPPFQELTVERHGDQELALLVGRAGRSHWSASFSRTEQGGLLVDVACRVSIPAEQLGSQYEIKSGNTKLLIAAAATDTFVDRPTSNRLRIEPANRPASRPATIRWRYVVVRPPN